MSGAGDLAQQGVKDLGTGAYAATILPSMAMSSIVLGIVTSHLLPWQRPIVLPTGGRIAPGLPSIGNDLDRLSVVDGGVLVVAIVFGAVLLRPFTISAVRILEGYWERQGLLAVAAGMGVERHVRRREISLSRRSSTASAQSSVGFKQVAAHSRASRRAARLQTRARRVLKQYPDDPEYILPTILGNVLRRGETTAGERYGMSTLDTYSRLHKFFSERLNSEIGSHLNVLDSTAAFVYVFALSTLLTTPLVLRLDLWALVPAGFSIAAVLSYRGAVLASEYWSVLAATAYDLHRFELVKAMGLPLPESAEDEIAINMRMSRVFAGELTPSTADTWTYALGSSEQTTPNPGVRGAARPLLGRRRPRR